MENRITLRHLEAFRAIMVRKTVTGAADMLEVTQPVVTRLISDLEERIGINLFNRTRGRLLPTPEAVLLIKDVEQSLIGIERIANAASNIKALKMGHLEIAAAPSMALSFLPRAINSFNKEHPDTTVSMHMYSSSIVLDMVQRDRCDLGFAMFPMKTSRQANSETLLSAKMVGVIPVNHRLASKTVLQPEDFEGESFISLMPLMEARVKIDTLMLAHGVKRKTNIETQISAAILKLAEAGAGVSIIDPLTASGYTGSALKFIPFGPVIENNYSIVISERNSSTLILKPLLDHARREIRRMVAPSLIIRS